MDIGSSNFTYTLVFYFKSFTILNVKYPHDDDYVFDFLEIFYNINQKNVPVLLELEAQMLNYANIN